MERLQLYIAGLLFNRNRSLQTSKAPLESQVQDAGVLTGAGLNQRGCLKGTPEEVQVRLPEGQRRQNNYLLWRVSFRARVGRLRIG